MGFFIISMFCIYCLLFIIFIKDSTLVACSIPKFYCLEGIQTLILSIVVTSLLNRHIAQSSSTSSSLHAFALFGSTQ